MDSRETDTGDRIDELVGRCLVQILDRSGHGLYLRHPLTRESVLVGFSDKQEVARQTRERLRRVLLGIVYEALQLSGGEPARGA